MNMINRHIRGIALCEWTFTDCTLPAVSIQEEVDNGFAVFSRDLARLFLLSFHACSILLKYTPSQVCGISDKKNAIRGSFPLV